MQQTTQAWLSCATTCAVRNYLQTCTSGEYYWILLGSAVGKQNGLGSQPMPMILTKIYSEIELILSVSPTHTRHTYYLSTRPVVCLKKSTFWEINKEPQALRNLKAPSHYGPYQALFHEEGVEPVVWLQIMFLTFLYFEKAITSWENRLLSLFKMGSCNNCANPRDINLIPIASKFSVFTTIRSL